MVCEEDFIDMQGVKRGISVSYSFNLERRKCSLQVVLFFFLSFFFKGERHLFLWQCQYSMD